MKLVQIYETDNPQEALEKLEKSTDERAVKIDTYNRCITCWKSRILAALVACMIFCEVSFFSFRLPLISLSIISLVIAVLEYFVFYRYYSGMLAREVESMFAEMVAIEMIKSDDIETYEIVDS